jgi:hypothetical protein
MSKGMTSEDYTFEYLTMQLRKKYGRRVSAWRIHKKLMNRAQQPGERLDSFINSLTNIGFGKRVSTESYLEAFYDGLNNQDAAAHVSTIGPTTLGEALEIAVGAYGEFGAGRKVTSWQGAQRRYQRDVEDEEKPRAAPQKISEARVEASPAINWEQLGLGFGGGDTAPMFDDEGRALRGLASSTSGRDGGLPLAALQAIAVAAGIGQAAAARTPTARSDSNKPKVAKTLEVKAEPQTTENQAPPNNQQYGAGNGYDYGGRGRGGFGSSRGRGGRSGNYGDVSNYGPRTAPPWRNARPSRHATTAGCRATGGASVKRASMVCRPSQPRRRGSPFSSR